MSPKPKPSTTARGYGHVHQQRRRELEPDVRSGRAICTRCRQPIAPHEQWALDHADSRAGYLGAAHARCNGAAGADKANASKAAKQERREVRRWSREWFVAEPGTIVDYGNGRTVEY